MSKYKFYAYFNYTFVSENLSIDKNTLKTITGFIKKSIEKHRNEINQHNFNSIKFQMIDILFDDMARKPRDVYRIYLLLSNKKKPNLELVDKISDECFDSLKAKYVGFKIVPGVVRIKTIKNHE